MKKMLIAVAVVLTAGLMASCNKGEGCYKLTYTVEMAGVKTEVVEYVYGDGEDIDKAKTEVKEEMKKLGIDAKIKQTKVSKNADDCAAANLK